MARTSRIPHPTGGRLVILYEWAVKAVGKDAAAVLGVIDFLDRAQDQPGQAVASRARLLADLEGLVSEVIGLRPQGVWKKHAEIMPLL